MYESDDEFPEILYPRWVGNTVPHPGWSWDDAPRFKDDYDGLREWYINRADVQVENFGDNWLPAHWEYYFLQYGHEDIDEYTEFKGFDGTSVLAWLVSPPWLEDAGWRI